MRQMLWNQLRALVLSCGTAFVVGCSNYVLIPDAGSDREPTITVHSLPSGPGVVSPGEVSVTTGTPVGVSEHTTVLITVDATGVGGVKSLSIIGHQAGNKMWEVTRVGLPNAQGMVPKTLSIVGHDGHGGIGGNPLLFALRNLYETADVKAEATNFHNQTATLRVKYEVLQKSLIKQQ